MDGVMPMLISVSIFITCVNRTVQATHMGCHKRKVCIFDMQTDPIYFFKFNKHLWSCFEWFIGAMMQKIMKGIYLWLAFELEVLLYRHMNSPDSVIYSVFCSELFLTSAACMC